LVDGAGTVNGGNSGESLRDKLVDPDVRRRLCEVLSIGSLLENCIIDKTYRVTDDFVAPIRLTALGDSIFEELRAGRARLKPNDIRLSLFLKFGCSEGLLIHESTDVGALRREITKDIKSGKILFPYIFGRELHDLAAELAPEKTTLDNPQTLNLLRKLPVGVFQLGYTTVGPFGAIVSDSARALGAQHHAPGYLCSDETCSAIHSIELSTALSASIVKAREVVDSHVDRKYSVGEDEHTRIMADAMAKQYDIYDLRLGDTLIEALADDCSPSELRLVAERAIRDQFREIGSTELSKRLSSVIQNPADYVTHLSTAGLLQLLLTFSEEALVRAVDAAVADGGLQLTEAEIRTRHFSRFGSNGQDLLPEIGARGARYRGLGVNTVVARRLLALLHRLYFESDALSAGDLAYQLDDPSVRAEDPDLLDRAVRTFSPERIIRDLVLSNRRASLAAGEYLGVSVIDGATKSDLLPTFLWKLGAPIELDFNDLQRVERLENELSAGVSGVIDDQEDLRGTISNLFTAVEDAAQRAVEFGTWALTVDHFLEHDGFLYDPAPNPAVLAYLDDAAPVEEAFRLKSNGRNTLAPLAAAFSRLAKSLEGESAGERLRPAGQYPQLTRDTARPFCFASTIPFLNLAEASRTSVLASLRELSRLMGDDVVLRVRNGTLHGNNTFPTMGEISLVRERIAAWRSELLASGLYPRVYRLQVTLRDELGRREHLYNNRGDEIRLYDPSWAYAPGLPVGSPQLVIVPCSVLPSAGPLRFVLKARPGRDPYWDGWPKRWRTEMHYSSSEPGGNPGQSLEMARSGTD
jgi:hypothetical protein